MILEETSHTELFVVLINGCLIIISFESGYRTIKTPHIKVFRQNLVLNLAKILKILHIILLSIFYPPKIDVALKITIGSKFNNDLSYLGG
jgi:hypothetical protein